MARAVNGSYLIPDVDGSVSRTIASYCAERGHQAANRLGQQGLLLYLASPRETVPWPELGGVLVNKYRGHALLTRKSKLARLLRGYDRHPPTFVLSPPAVLLEAASGKQETALQARIAVDKRQAMAEENATERQALRDADAAHPGCWIVKDAQGAKGSNIYVCGSAKEVRFTPQTLHPAPICSCLLTRAAGFRSQAEAEVDSGRHSTAAVVQAYIADPYLLPGGRKFDVRVWVLIDPWFRVYAHRQGVCRTSSVMRLWDGCSARWLRIRGANA